MRILVWSLALGLFACGGSTIDVSGDAGGDASQQKTGTTACDGQTCAEGEACVVLTAGGGACQLPDDAGVCPNGSHSNGCCDNTTTTWTCTKLPSACNGALACPCAESLCQCGGCEVADAGVLSCQCMYP